MSIKIKLVTLCYFCLLLDHPADAQAVRNLNKQQNFNEERSPWQSDASQAIAELQYHFNPVNNDQYAAVNQQNKLGFIVSSEGYSIRQVLTNSKSTSFDLNLLIKTVQHNAIGKATGISATDADRLVYSYRDADVEYINTPAGLRQNFIIARKKGNKHLQLTLGVESSLEYEVENGEGLVFRDPETQKIEMVYDGLKVWDAHHRLLPASMRLKDHTLTLDVDDRGAAYPVTIDPLNHSYDWSASSDGLLPALLNNGQLQIDALYGYSAASLGDINNDGYDDVAIGAPGTVNIVGASTFLQAGAVFVYLGSATGLSSAPSKVLWATTPVAGALFGFSVASGDVVGNSRNDIIVGAPLDSYSTLAATAIIGTSSATVTAGKVYIFDGASMSTASPSPFAEVKLQGSNFFSKGIVGLLASNVSVKNLFGFAVGTADDLNNDGKSDLIVGVPGYLSTALLAARSGAAFVYYSNALSSTTPTQLTTPSPSLLGLASLPILNTDGLLFGFSVDGAGDFNGDGNPDVVVGAPAGINLNSLGGIFSGKLLSGSAFVFYGNGSGITPTTTTRLDPSAGGLLATSPNLMGYSVKGVRNASRIRNGRILVGAPLGNVLSNLAGGLKLKTGNVHVFTAFSPGAITPVQTIPSSRGTSLLSVLSGQGLTVSSMFGASMDNVMDVNCDGVSDIVIGEPLSSGVGLIGVNAVGGAASILTGNADGTYSVAPFDMITTVSSMDAGVNVASMLGISVTGVGLTHGNGLAPRYLAGAPGKSLDFGSGVLDLGASLSTLWSFAAVDNGLGKAFEFTTGSCSILPATLLSFKGVKDNTTSLLSWNTTAEINITGFQVMRSSDGVHFSAIGSIASITSNQAVHQYKWVDQTPASGVNYYRLKLINKDSHTTLSGIVQISFDNMSLGIVRVAPNPVVGNLIHVQLNGLKTGKYRIDLLSMEGRRHRSLSLQMSQEQYSADLDRNNLPAGIYSVNVYSSDNTLIRAERIVLLD